MGNAVLKTAKVICSDGVYNKADIDLKSESDTSNALDKNWKKNV